MPARFPHRLFLRSLSLLAVLLWPIAAVAGANAAPTALRVREPAVAGLFYPKDPAALTRAIDRYLAAATPENPPGELKAILCPHAGYAYSGPVAAFAFKLLQSRSYSTVLLLAPSHYAELSGASVSGADIFRTPLGDVPLSPRARDLGKLYPFSIDASCVVHRPEWAADSSRQPPAAGREDADTWEHADEVEVPFLQQTLHRFSLVPVICGDLDPARAAKALQTWLDNNTLIVVSSDLSHYDTYANARKRDRRCVDAIEALDADRIHSDDACGAIPLRILLHLARAQGWQARLLDYRNSGDTSGEKTKGVVGYAAVAFFAPAPAAAPFTPEEQKSLLDLARRALRDSVSTGSLPKVSPDSLPPRFREERACFVTLTKHGELRGCIGHLTAQEPLYRAILDNARSAALRDSRFSPVTAAELDELRIEISVLTPPRPLTFASPADLLRQLRPGQDGVVLQIGGQLATFLPQVWEQLPDKTDFLDQLAEKAGCPRSAWRGPDVRVSVYQVEAFAEEGPP